MKFCENFNPFSPPTADTGDFESEEKDAEYMAEQGLLQVEVGDRPRKTWVKKLCGTLTNRSW